MTFTNMVVMIVVSVGLSLGCAYILFKKLKSFAETETEIKGKKIQLGGAIAGFVVILGILLYSFDGWHKNETGIQDRINTARKETEEKWKKEVEKWKPQEWTIIVKRVKKKHGPNDDGNGDQSGIEGSLVPAGSDWTSTDGTFRLENVVYVPARGWPEILFEYEGYHSFPIDIEKEIEKGAGKVDIDWKKKKLTLIKDITLPLIKDNTLAKKIGGEK